MKKLLNKLTLALALIGSSFMNPWSIALADVKFDFKEKAIDEGLVGTENAADGDGGFGFWIGRILEIVVVFAALVLFFNLILAGLEWINSGGDSSKIQKARDKIFQSVIGFIVLFSAIALFSLVQKFLEIEILTFTN